MHAEWDWQTVEEVPSKDIATISEYLQTWELKFSTIKAVLAVFHFNNKETKRELWMASCGFAQDFFGYH